MAHFDASPIHLDGDGGLAVDPTIDYHVYGLNDDGTETHHHLGSGYTDGEELVTDAKAAVDTDSFHLVEHVLMHRGEGDAEEVTELLAQLTAPPVELVKTLRDPRLADIEPEVNADFDDFSDAELLKQILRARLWEIESPHAETTSRRRTAELKERLAARGYDLDDYEDALVSDGLVADVIDE